jgi:hypothetical protein
MTGHGVGTDTLTLAGGPVTRAIPALPGGVTFHALEVDGQRELRRARTSTRPCGNGAGALDNRSTFSPMESAVSRAC